MGATASRSSPTTHLVTIRDYSKLAQMPVPYPLTFSTFFFCDLPCNVRVCPNYFNEGLPDYFFVSVIIVFPYILDLDIGTDISIEILDETGEHTVFHEKSSRDELELSGCVMMAVNRRELEASSCIHDDSFTVRCTIKQATKRRLGNFSKSQKLAVLKPQVAMVGSHTLTINSFSKLKAALRGREGARSTHFDIGGCIWYLELCPNDWCGFPCLYLICETKDFRAYTSAVHVEFSLELEGSMNFESEKMMLTLDPAEFGHEFRYELMKPSTSAMHDRLVVRCCLTVMTVEKPSLPPATISKTTPGNEYPSLSPAVTPTTIPDTESVLTPLLSAMYG